MFEKPKALGQLSEYELQNIVMYLSGSWDGSAPNPGYSWQEHFSDAGIGEVPPWFHEWIGSFELDDLVGLEGTDGHWRTLSIIRHKREAALVTYARDEPVERVGEVSYPLSVVTAQWFWPFVTDYLSRADVLKLRVWDPVLVPKEKMAAFLKDLGLGDSDKRLQEIYSEA